MGEVVAKVVGYPLVFVVMFVVITAGTYVPVLGSPSLSLWHVPEPTVHMSVTDADVEGGEVRVPEAEKACDHVPFLVHALAAPPKTVRVVVSNSGVERGEMKVDCDSGQPIEDSVKVY